jgi:plasmid maintenance system killer protein
MGVSTWVAQHWLDLAQTVGIVGGLLFSAYVTWKDERARRVGNSIAITEQYRQIWKELYERAELSRVLAKDADVQKQPVSNQEELFVKTLVLHLGTVYRAMKHSEFVELEGLRKDVREFFSLPIPGAVWQLIKSFQDREFVKFVEASLA